LSGDRNRESGRHLPVHHPLRHAFGLDGQLATGAVTAVGLRDAPLDMMFTPDGTHVYVSNEHSLTVIDTTNTDACDWGDYFSNAVAVISVPMLRDLLGNT